MFHPGAVQKEHHFLQGVSSSIVRHDAFMKRHGFNWRDLCSTLKGFKQLKVVVIGEIIVDEYINCDPLGMSQEDPTIVVTPVAKNKYIGGEDDKSTTCIN